MRQVEKNKEEEYIRETRTGNNRDNLAETNRETLKN